MAAIGKLELKKIIADPRCQPRAQMSFQTIEEWADLMRRDVGFPALVTFHDGKNFWLADGFTRRAAAERAGLAEYECEMREGTVEDAIVFSCAANIRNKAQMWTNADKRRAVERMLRVKPEWTDGRIGKHCDTHQTWVNEIRARLSQGSLEMAPPTRLAERGGKEYQIDTANIGKPTEEPRKLRHVPPTDWDSDEPSEEEKLRKAYDVFALDVRTVANRRYKPHELVGAAPDVQALEDLRGDCEALMRYLAEIIEATKADERTAR